MGQDASKAAPDDRPEQSTPLIGTLARHVLLETGEFSDLKLICGDTEWRVHNAVVSTRSPFFRACCKNFKEAEEDIIRLPDDNKHVVAALLGYLYTADYDDKLAIAEFQPIVFSVHVHSIADKYHVPELAVLAAIKVTKRAACEWNTSAFADAIEELWETSHASKIAMQNYMVGVAAKHITELRSEDFGTRFREVCETNASFSFALLKRVLDAKKPFVASNQR